MNKWDTKERNAKMLAGLCEVFLAIIVKIYNSRGLSFSHILSSLMDGGGRMMT
jgi:hypothetical protein